MSMFGKYFAGLFSRKSSAAKTSGDMRKATGAGPAVAAHSKDAKTSAVSGQNQNSARKGK